MLENLIYLGSQRWRKKTIIVSVNKPIFYGLQTELVQETIWIPENDLETKPLSHIKKVNKHNKNFLRGK